VIALVGATGTGKSELSLDLAERIETQGGHAEIVGADAMQLYRGMDIGTAKVPPALRRGIPHHLLDTLEVTEDASVARYQTEAREAIAGVLARGAVPILVGGSGLYVSSVLYDFSFPPHDAALRRRLEEEAADHGTAGLLERLRRMAPDVARRIDPANARRVVRALEAVELGEGDFTGRLPVTPVDWYEAVVVGLEVEREQLLPVLNERVVRMWRDGLVDEVESLLPYGLAEAGTARRAIGYAQALDQLHGRLTHDEAIAQTQQRTRRFARRQVGWFRRYPDIQWVHTSPGGPSPLLAVARLAGW
jgi:tRNA dimethylallyltransferase